MEALKFVSVEITFDKEQTISIYKQISKGSPEECGCLYCQNWFLVRDKAYPKEFVNFLDQLGIDSKKEAEIYYGGQSFENPDLHAYGGWFHGVGHIGKNQDYIKIGDTFNYWVTGHIVVPNRLFDDKPLIQIEFLADVPWRLPDPTVTRGAKPHPT